MSAEPLHLQGQNSTPWRSWVSFTFKWLIQAVFVAVVLGALSFFMLRSLPGDAAFRVAAARYGYDLVDAAAAQAVRAELGLDRSWWQQLAAWLLDTAQLNLGHSMVSGEKVIDELAHQLGATVELSVVAWVLGVLLGVALGVTAALRQGWVGHAVDAACTLLRASPAFLIGLMLMLVVAVKLQWLPVAGHDEAGAIVLPALSLALALCPGIAQVIRAKLSQVLTSDSFEYAQTKGLTLPVALLRHALPAVALPTLAYASVQLVLLVEGVVIVETLFSWPGIGHAMVHAIFARDVPMIQGTALVMGMLFVALNALVALTMRLLDPRLRHAPAGFSKSLATT
jgi:peptide/nickel transport system permease protein